MISFRSPLDGARWWHKDGFQPVVVQYGGKNPIDIGWPQKQFSEDELPKHFNGRVNVGVKLGEPAGEGDVDLDCAEALAAWLEYAPPTGRTFGRASKPRSHWFYRLDPPIPSIKYTDPIDKKTALIELRCLKKDGAVGFQTVVPLSVHESGEEIRFDSDGIVANVDAAVLSEAVARTAAAALLARHFPPALGGRNDAFLAIAGILIRAGWRLEETLAFHRALYRSLWPDPNFAAAKGEVENSYTRHAAGGMLYGIPKLKELIDRNVIDKFLEWLNIQPGPAAVRPAPSAFRLTDEGVVYLDPDPEKEPLRVCGRLDVAAFTRDANSDGWGRLLRWCDSEGRPHEWAMPMCLLAGDGNEYRGRLLDGGLYLAPGRKARELLTVYLQTVRPQAWALCVARVGWHDGVFVLPGACIGPDGTAETLFQSPFETEHYFRVAGTVEEWRHHVGRFCRGNSRLIVTVSCSFAGPLLKLAGAESGGVHFHGATSTGKTTGLLVGGSVMGGGGRNGYVQTWRTTANGLEATAELHNDLTLFLDELGQMDAREAGETAYLLGNGSGKNRMSRNIGLRKKLSWSLLFVSAGELTLSDHVRTAGKRTRGGAEIRLLNIEADAGAGLGLFEDLHGAESPDAFARQLKDAAGRYYGAPLREYLEFLARNRTDTKKAIKNFQADFLSRHVPPGASGEVSRAAQRFALIAAAGELATEAGITGWDPGEARDAATKCLHSWLASRGTTGPGDAEAGVNQVRHFLEAHGASRFQTVRYPAVEVGVDSPDENQVVVNRAGFRRKTAEGETEFLILREIFKVEVCQGVDYRIVARALAERNFLDYEPPNLTKRVRLPGNLGLIRAFSVRASILEG